MINENIIETSVRTIDPNEQKCKISLKTKKKKLIMSGGGVKGIAHIGALQAFYEHGILQDIDTFAGTSVGAFISALLILGFTPNELFKFISEFDFAKAKGMDFKNLLTSFGLDDGYKFEIILGKFFNSKQLDTKVTFRQLFEKTKKTLIVTAVCLNDKKTYYFSHITYPDMPVITAIRMSISVPVYFIPVKHDGKLFVDGGCIDNYPINLFNDSLDEVIGLYLTEKRKVMENIDNIEDYLLQTIECLLEGVTCNSLRGYDKYSIKINLEKISVINFNVDQKTKQTLFQAGYDAAMDGIDWPDRLVNK